MDLQLTAKRAHHQGKSTKHPSCVCALYATWGLRVRGLLATSATHVPIVLYPCHSIHTMGMTYAIDVAFISSEHRVIRVVRKLPPWKCMSANGASYVLERPARDTLWFEAGDVVDMNVLA